MFFLLWMLAYIVPIGFVYLIIKNHSYAKEIPMPDCNILTGHVLSFLEMRGSLDKLTDMLVRNGGIIRVYIPPSRPSIIVTEPRIIQQILTSENALEKGVDYGIFRRWLGKGMLTADRISWRANRRMLSPCFGRLSSMVNFLKIFESNGNEFIKTLEREMRNGSTDVIPLAKELTMNAICASSMGISELHQDDRSKYVRCIEALLEITSDRLISMYKKVDFIYKFSKDYKKETELLKTVEEVLDKVIDERLNSYKNDEVEEESKIFLDTMLKYRKLNILSNEQIRDEMNTFLFGGHDTTAASIAFTLYALAQNPEIQDKVLREQHEIFGSFGEDHEVSYTDIQQMKYLELVIYESLRMYPPAPFIGRQLTSRMELGNGMFLPKDHGVGIFIYGCHHNPKYFPEPKKFDPERFQKDVTPYSFIPFSHGPRNCIGKKFALVLMKSCLSKVVRNFRILPSEPDHQIYVCSKITLCSENGVKISLEKRQSSDIF